MIQDKMILEYFPVFTSPRYIIIIKNLDFYWISCQDQVDLLRLNLEALDVGWMLIIQQNFVGYPDWHLMGYFKGFFANARADKW